VEAKELYKWVALGVTVAGALLAFYRTQIETKAKVEETAKDVQEILPLIKTLHDRQFEMQLWQIQIRTQLEMLKGDST